MLAGVEGEGHGAGLRTEDAVVDCAEGCTDCEVSMHVVWWVAEMVLTIPGTTLLDTGEVEGAKAVEPLQEFLSAGARAVSHGLHLP